MRVLTYNIHGCLGMDRRQDPERIVHIVEESKADIVGLQEVFHFMRDGRDFLDMLQCLGYPEVHFGQALEIGGIGYGNVLMLKRKAIRVDRADISRPGRQARSVLSAEVDFKGAPLKVSTTHLGLSARERRAQISALQQILAEESGKQQLLMGDFNEWSPLSRALRRMLRESYTYSKLRTFPARFPTLPLDRVCLYGPETASVRYSTYNHPEARLASDHLPLMAELGQRP